MRVASPFSAIRLYRLICAFITCWIVYFILLAAIHFTISNIILVSALIAVQNTFLQAKFISPLRKSVSPRKLLFSMVGTRNSLFSIGGRIAGDLLCSYLLVHWICGLEFAKAHYLAISVVGGLDQFNWMFWGFNVAEMPENPLLRSIWYKFRCQVFDARRIFFKPFVPLSIWWIVFGYVLIYFFGLSFYGELFKNYETASFWYGLFVTIMIFVFKRIGANVSTIFLTHNFGVTRTYNREALENLIHSVTQNQSLEAKFLALEELYIVSRYDKDARAIIFANSLEGYTLLWKHVLKECSNNILHFSRNAFLLLKKADSNRNLYRALAPYDFTSNYVSPFEKAFDNEFCLRRSVDILSYLFSFAAKGEDFAGTIYSITSLTEVLFFLLSADEAIQCLSSGYQKLHQKPAPSQGPISKTEQKFLDMDVLVWHAISRILEHCYDDLSSVGLPHAYANRLERYCSEIGA